MKRICIVLAVILSFILITNQEYQNVFVEDTGFEERFNDRQIMDAVKKISSIAGVTEVAVLSQNRKILAGILAESTAENENIMLRAEEIIKKSFPGIVVRKIFVEDDTALDIIELSYYVESDLEPKILKKRFDYLADK